MNDLQNWTEVTRGLYRYVIAPYVCYEIHILYHDCATDILTAKANLYIVGKWHTEEGSSFERECLMSEQPVLECLAEAVKDNDENNK